MFTLNIEYLECRHFFFNVKRELHQINIKRDAAKTYARYPGIPHEKYDSLRLWRVELLEVALWGVGLLVVGLLAVGLLGAVVRRAVVC